MTVVTSSAEVTAIYDFVNKAAAQCAATYPTRRFVKLRTWSRARGWLWARLGGAWPEWNSPIRQPTRGHDPAGLFLSAKHRAPAPQ